MSKEVELDFESEGGFGSACGDKTTMDLITASLRATGWAYDESYSVWLAPGYNSVPGRS